MTGIGLDQRMGLGIGLSAAIPRKPFPAAVRALPLPNFPGVTIGALWRGKKTLLVDAFLAQSKLQAGDLG